MPELLLADESGVALGGDPLPGAASVEMCGDAEITERLNALFADERLSDAQRREAAELAGTDWSDERW
jgi:hypothetical protein